ncbi:MAG TPA: flagellar hook-associated protein FlgK [Feifaniaceae bacterium]|nr:flagellar hook-associated protein FlgK [Feifaniaceae bacterium]
MSSFYGLEIAKTGLFISQKGINLAGHNIANADTKGYTRQRLSLASIDPVSLTARFLPIRRGAVGGGVAVLEIEQLRNAYVDRMLRNENSSLGQWNTRTSEMEYIETIFNTVGDANLSNSLADFFDSVQEFSAKPVSKEMRTNLQHAAISLTETFGHYYKQLTTLRSQMNDSISVTVNRINEITQSIAEYNEHIQIFEISGENANDLRDKRNVLLDELSGLVDMEYQYTTDTDGQEKLTVRIAGNTVVDHSASYKLKVVADANGDYDVCMDNAAETPVNYTNGEIEGYRQLRDGSSPDDMGIPYLMNELNKLAQGIAKQFNDIHKQGWTMPHDSVVSQQGVYLFHVDVDGSGVEDYSSITAGNFSISDAVLNDVYMLAASSKEIDFSSSDPQDTNNDIALALAALGTSSVTMGNTSFEGYLKNLVVELGVSSAHCEKMLTSEQTLVSNLESRKESVSGVSVDEEMVQLMKFQHMYNASSRVITSIDELLDKLINGTGIVGR